MSTDAFDVAGDPEGPAARAVVFRMGLAEAVSYFKSCLCPRIVIRCGCLTDDEKLFWKKLWFGGLGEYFYINNISADFDSFVNIECPQPDKATVYDTPRGRFDELIPVGGGKDSAVTAELLAGRRDKNIFITVNDQQARTDTVTAAGYEAARIIRVYRTIAPELLDLNSRGFLNGHTPFSSVVAFISLYAAYICGAKYIVLSNESSANEGNISGSGVNHQFSKSFGFERGFNDYVKANICSGIDYFSLLRPFCELQIAAMFSRFPQYLPVFRSCNRGSKKNVRCGECAKCLFVFTILSPFVGREDLVAAIGRDMLADASLAGLFDGLTGLSAQKPFECVGTVNEVRAACTLAVRRYRAEGRELPALLSRFAGTIRPTPDGELAALFSQFNTDNLIPGEFIPAVNDMLQKVKMIGGKLI